LAPARGRNREVQGDQLAMRPFRPLVLAVGVVTSLGLALPAAAAPPATSSGGPATGVSVQVTGTSPGVTVRPASRSYGRVDPGQTKTVGTFALGVPAGWPLGIPVQFSLHVAGFVGATP
jgi:hypothetical protein